MKQNLQDLWTVRAAAWTLKFCEKLFVGSSFAVAGNQKLAWPARAGGDFLLYLLFRGLNDAPL